MLKLNQTMQGIKDRLFVLKEFFGLGFEIIPLFFAVVAHHLQSLQMSPTAGCRKYATLSIRRWPFSSRPSELAQVTVIDACFARSTAGITMDWIVTVLHVFLVWNFNFFYNLNQFKINHADSQTQQLKDKTVMEKLFGWKVVQPTSAIWTYVFIRHICQTELSLNFVGSLVAAKQLPF